MPSCRRNVGDSAHTARHARTGHPPDDGLAAPTVAPRGASDRIENGSSANPPGGGVDRAPHYQLLLEAPHAGNQYGINTRTGRRLALADAAAHRTATQTIGTAMSAHLLAIYA